MAEFKIEKATAGGKTWKATGTNPVTGRQMTITGGLAGAKVGKKKNPEGEKTFDARHDATGMTPKKYINKLRWDDKGAFGSTVTIPDELFKKTAAEKSASKKTASKKGAAKKAASKKGAAKKTASKKAAPKNAAGKKAATKQKAREAPRISTMGFGTTVQQLRGCFQTPCFFTMQAAHRQRFFTGALKNCTLRVLIAHKSHV